MAELQNLVDTCSQVCSTGDEGAGKAIIFEKNAHEFEKHASAFRTLFTDGVNELAGKLADSGHAKGAVMVLRMNPRTAGQA